MVGWTEDHKICWRGLQWRDLGPNPRIARYEPISTEAWPPSSDISGKAIEPGWVHSVVHAGMTAARLPLRICGSKPLHVWAKLRPTSGVQGQMRPQAARDWHWINQSLKG